jgi:hypothetical protein
MNITKVKKKIDLLTKSERILEVTIDDKVVWVPKVDGNRHYQAVLEWEKIDGNDIEEAD